MIIIVMHGGVSSIINFHYQVDMVALARDAPQSIYDFFVSWEHCCGDDGFQ